MWRTFSAWIKSKVVEKGVWIVGTDGPSIAREECSSGSWNSCVIEESLALKCFVCERESTISGTSALKCLWRKEHGQLMRLEGLSLSVNQAFEAKAYAQRRWEVFFLTIWKN